MTRPMILRTALKSYPHTIPLKNREITDPRVELDFAEVEPIHGAFAPMARQQAYDVSEMAIVTYLQARAYDKPLVLLPMIIAARLQQGCIVYNANRGEMSVSDLVGAKVGVRSYSQTTGMWVRGILENTYGIDPQQIQWVTFKGSHLEEYQDPEGFVSRAGEDKVMLDMLLDGEIDAAIFGNDLPNIEGIKPLIPNAKEADQVWYEQQQLVPPNHVVVMKRDIVEQSPQVAQAVYDLLKKGKESVSPPISSNYLPTGVDDMRRSLELALEYCEQQQLLPKKLDLEEILAECHSIFEQ